jgi:hypothetical protein
MTAWTRRAQQSDGASVCQPAAWYCKHRLLGTVNSPPMRGHLSDCTQATHPARARFRFRCATRYESVHLNLRVVPAVHEGRTVGDAVEQVSHENLTGVLEMHRNDCKLR